MIINSWRLDVLYLLMEWGRWCGAAEVSGTLIDVCCDGRCYEGGHYRMLPRDCLAKGRSEVQQVGRQGHSFLSSSVSETEEWVCSKIIHLNGSISR